MNEKKQKRRLKKPVALGLVLALLASVLFVNKHIPEIKDKLQETGVLEALNIEEIFGGDSQENQAEEGSRVTNEGDRENPVSEDVYSFLSGSEDEKNESEENAETKQENSPVIARGACNSFAGYTAAIIANGGLETEVGSYYYQNGINVSIDIEDDDDVIIEAFKNGEIDFFFLTVNKMPLVCEELKDTNKEAVIPYITDTSTGGDGIVANLDYNSIPSLQDAKIGMAKNSVSEAMLLWLYNVQSGMDVKTAIQNFELYSSTQEAVDAFVHGEIEAVATWDLASALRSEESHLLFSSKDAEYLIIDALVVDKEFAEENSEIVEKIIDGCITVVNDINNDVNMNNSYEIIRESIPDFSSYDDATIRGMLNDSKQLGYRKNIEAFEIASGIYKDFCKIWNQMGFATNAENADNLFDDRYIKSLSDKWENKENAIEEKGVVAKENIIDREALVSQTANLLFEANSAEFLPGYEAEDEAMLDEFVKNAKILNRMVIKIEGNVSLTPGNVSTEFDYELSRLRAQHAKEYLVAHGIEEERIIIVANGGDKPIASNETAEGRKMNRNCRISFYQGETEAEAA